jgi:hypothetical protein
MYEKTYGEKYEAQQGLSTTEIAKLIRADIKTAVKDGTLPSTWKYSVKTEYFSGGSSIDVRVKNCADAWMTCDGTVPGSKQMLPNGSWTARACSNMWCKGRNEPEYAHAATEHKVLTEQAEAAKAVLQAIHNAYNHDGSESMVDYFDVNYYGTVNFEGGW